MKCFLRVLLGLWALLSTAQASTPNVTSSTWRLKGVGVGTGVQGKQTGVTVRSRLNCVTRCRALSHCSSFVFDPSSRTCLLLPHLNTADVTSYLGEVYAETDPKCDPDEAPAVNGSLQWAHTLTSMMASVTCLDDFTNSTSDVSLQCLADGAWRREGQCVQTVFKNPPLMPLTTLPLLPVVKGWSLCLEGIPNERFIIILAINDTHNALGTDFRFPNTPLTSPNKVVMTHRAVNYSSERIVDNPFAQGQPFTLKIKATMDDTFEIYADNNLIYTYQQDPGLPATDVTKAAVIFNVNITRLDLWCF